jgi:iron complex outermembrane receptor protein
LRAVLSVSILLFGTLTAVHAQSPKLTPDCPPDSASPSADCQQKERKVEPRKEVIAVTGTFTPVPVENIDRALTVIDTRQDSLLYGNWVEYLHADPSIDLQQRAPNDVQADLTIRGSTFGQTLVLLNGLRLNDAQTSHHNMDQPLPTPSLERIEVLRGAGSTFYGSDAVGGSINFITGPPQYSELRAGSDVGNFGVNQQTASGAFVRGRWDEQIGLERDFSSGFRPDRDYRNFTVFSDSGLQTDLGHSHVMLGYGDKPFGADQFYGDFNSWERTKSWFAGLEQDLGKNTEFDLGYRKHTDVFILFRDNPTFFSNDHTSESWQTAIRRKQSLGQNSTFFYGAEGFHDSVDSTNLGVHQRSREAFYADYDVRALGRFSFSAAGREEFYGSGQSEFSPTVSAGVYLKAGWKLKASASHAFRLPTYTDLYYHDPGNVGNPTLRPEKSWDYEGGVQWNQGGRYKADITVFHRRDREVIDYVLDTSSTPPIYRATNIQSLNFTGAETSLEVRLPHEQTLQLAYTGLYGAQNPLPGLTTKYTSNYPAHDAVVSWEGTLPGKFIARSRVGVVDRYKQDPYALWDVSMGREFRHVRAHLSLANISDTQYEEVSGVIMPGRSVVFGLEFLWRAKAR